jgi:large subunit ribosomal protein L9
MEVILREDVAHLGRIGEVVRVKDGYARNYLIPYGKAYPATEGTKRQVEMEHTRRAERLVLQRNEAEAFAAQLADVTLAFTAKTGDGDRLFGSITAADIAEKLAAAGHHVDKRHIELHEPIKLIGEHRVPIRLHAEVRPEILVTVDKET